MPDQPQPFDHWAVVELFGHTQIAGRVSETTVGGCPFVRVDVPATDSQPAFTRLLGNGAIYSMTICEKEVVYEALKHYRPRPVSSFTFPGLTPPGGIQQSLIDDDNDEYGRFKDEDEEIP